jgi:signal transduction histidine kinase
VKEVSCRVFDIFFEPLRQKGVPAAKMVEGTTVSLATLRDKKERIDWADFCRIMSNLRPHFTDAEFIELGHSYFRAPTLRFAFAVARVLLSPMGFYRWLNKPREGVGNQMFSCVVPKHEEISETECYAELTLPEGYEVCWPFFVITIGNFEEMPRLLGQPPAKVTLTRIPRGGRFHIQVAEGQPLLTRVKRAITYPFTMRAVAKELMEAHETLQERYQQLEDAKAALARRQMITDAAYRLGNRIFGELEPAAIARIVVEGLTEVAGVAGACVRVTGDGTVVDEAGTIGTDEEAVATDLPGRRERGRLAVWAGEDGNRDDARTLVELVAPTVALAFDNASAYREIQEYQRGLERLVEERTIELRQAVAQLREAQESRSKFFANISHEIRTPLSLILLSVADVEARAGAVLDGRAREDLQSIVDSARKLLRLVDELLLLAASRETELKIAPKTADLGRLVAALAATWRPAAEAGGLTLEVRAPERLLSIFDPVAIERVITNLLSNAVKFTPAGGRISLDVERADDEITIVVRDTGIGIPDDLMQRLFGRFERGSNTSTRGGSGIGLSLVRELVEAHEGKVEVERIEGGGTQFRVTLPARDPQRVVEETPAPRLRPSDFGVGVPPIRTGEVIAPRRSGATILVAEDDPRLADAIARLLGEEHTVVVALDGLAALDLVKKYQPHLLVTDVEMPGMDGIELTRKFREITGEKLAPVVILSAVADLGTRVAGLEAGAVDYVVKPFDPAELQARVRSQLSMRDLAVRLHRAEQLSALGTLSSGLAHELRNPANAIVNAVGPLKMLLPPDLAKGDSPVAQLVDVLGSCAEQIGFLSRQLLSFKRGGDLELRSVTLQDVVARAVAQAQPSLRMIELRERIDVNGPIRCAPPLMVQVLSNLIDNASHAAGGGGWVELTAEDRGDRIVIEVADSGPGVPVELRDRIFEPFFTTKPPGVGTGLGLPLARDIVHRHGGVLEVRERGDRSVFVVELPRLPDPAATRAAARVMMQARGEGR